MELKVAVRRLLAAPLFTVFAVLSLGTGVAVTTAVYSIIDSVLFADAGIRGPDQVAFIVTPYDGYGRLLKGSVSEPDFRDWRAAQVSFTSVSAALPLRVGLESPSNTEVVSAEAVDPAYFSTLGVTAAIGRAFVQDTSSGDARTVVLSHEVWRTRFGADPGVLGQAVRISGVPFEVVGVAARSFFGANGRLGGTRLWIPIDAGRALSQESPLAPTVSARDRRHLLAFGRLGPSVTIADASAELTRIAARLDADFPPARRASDRPWRAKSVAEIGASDEILRRMGMAMIALVALILVVACTNLANLVLARGTIRQKDLTVRRALGASRIRLVREQCTESLLLAAAGGAAAYVMFLALRSLLQADITMRLPGGEPLTLEIRPALDLTAAGIAAGSLLLSLIVFGLEPAWQLTRTLDVRSALAQAASAGQPRTRRQRRLLRWQVAISAGFFVIATMFMHYTIVEARHDPGVDLDRLAVATLNLQDQGWTTVRKRQAIERVLAEASRDPLVDAVAVASALPFGTRNWLRVTLASSDAAAGEASQSAAGIVTSPELFRALRIPVLRGRGLEDGDAAGGGVVISEFTSRQMFGTVDAVGRQLALRGQRRDGTVTVVGVTGNTDVGQMLRDTQPLVYLPLGNDDDLPLTVALRSHESSGRAVAALRDALRRADPVLAVEAIGDARWMLSGPWVVLRAAGMGAIALGFATLVLAMVGLFGIQSHIVSHRTREIGIRLSIGATTAQIQRMILRDGYRPVLDGLVIGLFIGVIGRAIVRSYLEIDVSVVDPWILLVAPVPLVLAAFCACYLPARRAAAVDPNTALRCE